MTLPAPLDPTLQSAWHRVDSLAGTERCEQLRAVLSSVGLFDEFERLLALSHFIGEQAGRQIAWLLDALTSQGFPWTTVWTPEDYQAQIKALWESSADLSEATAMALLRRFRQREMLRIVWCDFTRRFSLDDTLDSVTALADACVICALDYAEAQLTPRYGKPMGADSGTPQQMVVLAMGKMGGRELNLSSDIDLIFTYPESGITQGGRTEVSNQEYFVKLGQLVIKMLDAVTPDGFVFRVDMRLRPYGDSGALVCNYDSLELYYQEQGREWERYALIKARAITGTPESRDALRSLLRPFVYRRYTDFGVIESLRDMKGMIEAETRRLGLENNIKKGSGGIREIEFIAQCLQLIHGGRTPALRCRGLVTTLRRLAQHQLLPTDDAEALIESYRFLRLCEHALQGMADAQTQTLPEAPLGRLQVALIMGFTDWGALVEALARVRQVVAQQFRYLIDAEPDAPEQSSTSLTFAELSAEVFRELGFGDPEGSFGALTEFLNSTRIDVLQGESRQRLQRFLPRLCEAAAKVEFSDSAFTRLLPFVTAVSRRSAYLVLLEENPEALAQLTFLAGRSPWIAEQLAGRPELLDELLDAARLYSAPSKEAMQSLLRQQLLRIPEDDLEEQMNVLRRIKDAVILRVAASELIGSIELMKISDNLTFLAEVILEHAIHVARADLVRKHGEPGGQEAGFAVLGYGKLGGIELSYDSDLDLVFVYSGGDGDTAGPKVIDNVRFYTRLAQRVVHVLSTKLAAGRLYEVDLRLRPHGDSGLVAVSLQGLRKYQLESAWVWEHQALVRTRAVAGDTALCRQLECLRAEILCQARDQNSLRDSVVAMRQRMLEAGTKKAALDEGEFDIKRSPGGIVDIEFVVQYLVLANAQYRPELTQWSDVIRVLDSLEQHAFIASEDATTLRQAYLAYRGAVHVAALQGLPAVGSRKEFCQHLDAVTRIRDHWLPGIIT
jgi:glutamate-ammonia-ligase adenylyltransferase